ncbi:hypothetical protein WJX74_000449 [Apatococcus lobatus]|uniref:ANTAR domain-containing protein n=1 Tax=Apatococcus lobatus TaxID=904363 RepID=A0AAW1Q5E8_9CHLO
MDSPRSSSSEEWDPRRASGIVEKLLRDTVGEAGAHPGTGDRRAPPPAPSALPSGRTGPDDARLRRLEDKVGVLEQAAAMIMRAQEHVIVALQATNAGLDRTDVMDALRGIDARLDRTDGLILTLVALIVRDRRDREPDNLPAGELVFEADGAWQR